MRELCVLSTMVFVLLIYLNEKVFDLDRLWRVLTIAASFFLKKGRISVIQSYIRK